MGKSEKVYAGPRRADRGVKGRRVIWRDAEWTVLGCVVYSNVTTLDLKRGARPFTATVDRKSVKFVKRDYVAKMEHIMKVDKDFRDFVEIAPCGHRGCGIPCSRWSFDE